MSYYFNKVLKANPSYTDIYYMRGVLKYDLSLFSEALTDFNKAIQFNQKDENAYYMRGTTKYELKNYKEALIDLLFFLQQSYS